MSCNSPALVSPLRFRAAHDDVPPAWERLICREAFDVHPEGGGSAYALGRDRDHSHLPPVRVTRLLQGDYVELAGELDAWRGPVVWDLRGNLLKSEKAVYAALDGRLDSATPLIALLAPTQNTGAFRRKVLEQFHRWSNGFGGFVALCALDAETAEHITREGVLGTDWLAFANDQLLRALGLANTRHPDEARDMGLLATLEAKADPRLAEKDLILSGVTVVTYVRVDQVQRLWTNSFRASLLGLTLVVAVLLLNAYG